MADAGSDKRCCRAGPDHAQQRFALLPQQIDGDIGIDGLMIDSSEIEHHFRGDRATGCEINHR